MYISYNVCSTIMFIIFNFTYNKYIVFQNPASNDYVFTPVAGAVSTAKSAPTVLPGQRIATPTSFLTEDDARMWAKERQKKDNHNMSKCSL